ncbi:MAG: SDR family oxidoreductase [Candidatus Helarchaeota archaeon]
MGKKNMFDGKIAMVVGGSQGIGKSIAKKVVQLGGCVCIIARRVEILKKAVKDIEEFKSNNEQFVEMISCDATDIEKLRPLINNFIEKKGIPYYLFNCVGQAFPDYIENLKLDDFRKTMDVNYYGVVAPILTLLPYYMKEKTGHIINLSSEAGFLGLMGYSTYCPSKFAIVGLSECLRHELKPYHIKISVVYPVDTETPGFEQENKTKPEELKIISARAGLMKPDEVANIIIKKMTKNKFNIFIGASGFHNWAKRHIPWFAFSELDKELKNARKKLGKDTNY